MTKQKLNAYYLNRGFSWYDTGTFESLNDASNIIRLTEQRQNIRIGCPYEVALRKNWISLRDIINQSSKFNSLDLEYLKTVL